MVEVEFDYNQQILVLQAKFEDIFQDIINKYLLKSLLNPNSTYFIANGKQINPQETVGNQMNEMNKSIKKIKVLVQIIEEENTNVQVTVQSKNIICPKCQEPCRISIDNYQVKLFECINKHSINSKIKDFPNTQKINISKIICEKCRIKNKGNCPNNEFYKCLNCDKNLCLLCKPNHDSNHNIIKYDQKYYICKYHNESYIKYCKDCNKNICYSCDDDHMEHHTIYLGDIKPNINDTKSKLSNIKKEIDIFINKIREIIKQLNDLIDNINIYYEIYNNILNNYSKQNRNHQTPQNIKDFNINNEIINVIKNINKMNNIKDEFNNIINIYNNINKNVAKEEIISVKGFVNSNNNNENFENSNNSTNRIKPKIDDTKNQINKIISKEENLNTNNNIAKITKTNLEMIKHLKEGYKELEGLSDEKIMEVLDNNNWDITKALIELMLNQCQNNIFN